MLVLRKDLGRTQVAALRYSLCLFLRKKGSKTYSNYQGSTTYTQNRKAAWKKYNTFFFLSLFAPARERESYEGLRVVTWLKYYALSQSSNTYTINNHWWHHRTEVLNTMTSIEKEHEERWKCFSELRKEGSVWGESPHCRFSVLCGPAAAVRVIWQSHQWDDDFTSCLRASLIHQACTCEL